MNIYFIVLVVLQLLGLGVLMGKHGEPRTDKYNFYMGVLNFTFITWIVYKAIEVGF